MLRFATFLSAIALSAPLVGGANAAIVKATLCSSQIAGDQEGCKANGWADVIYYDDTANRGNANDRDNPLNALGSDSDTFFEIGFGSSVYLKFGAAFVSPGTLIEVTNGNVSGWPESVDIYVGNAIQGGIDGDYIKVGSMTNTEAQDPGGKFTFESGLFPGGQFNTVRLVDTSTFPTSGSGGWDIGSVRVAIFPVPGALPLLLAGVGAFGIVARRKRKAAQA